MRLAARIDDNQKEVVKAFRKLGCSVLHLHQVGKGCPDLLVSRNMKSILIEIKDGRKSEAAQKLTKDERDFHASWQGLILIVTSLSDVLDAVRILER